MSTIELSDGSSSVCVLQSDDSSSKNALLAVPKKGRLYESCIKLLKGEKWIDRSYPSIEYYCSYTLYIHLLTTFIVLGAGLDHDRPNRLDVAKCFSLPITLVFLPAADIATYVAEGDVDAGITGLDVVHESNSEIVEILVRHHKFSSKLRSCCCYSNIFPFDRSIVPSL
jgi:ATP phosphoribosyltransferase